MALLSSYDPDFYALGEGYEVDPEPIGIGAFSTVHFAMRTDPAPPYRSKMVAVKAISKERTQDKAAADGASVPWEELIAREVEVMMELGSLGHKNVPKYFGSFEDEHYLYVSMQLCAGGELPVWLSKQVEPYTEAAVARIIFDLLQAICCCHDHLIVHRDIKPQNLLFTSAEPSALLKLVDFGLAMSRESPGHVLHEMCGTLDYMAPEMLDGAYNERVDVWAAGVLLYMLLGGSHPFRRESQNSTETSIYEARPSFGGPRWQLVSDGAADLCGALLAREPGRRISARDALRHPWIRSRNAAATNELAADIPERIVMICENESLFEDENDVDAQQWPAQKQQWQPPPPQQQQQPLPPQGGALGAALRRFRGVSKAARLLSSKREPLLGNSTGDGGGGGGAPAPFGQLQQPANGPSPTLSPQTSPTLSPQPSASNPPATNRQTTQEQWLQQEELAHEQLDAEFEASAEALERLLANGVPVRVRERRSMGVEMKWIEPWRKRTLQYDSQHFCLTFVGLKSGLKGKLMKPDARYVSLSNIDAVRKLSNECVALSCLDLEVVIESRADLNDHLAAALSKLVDCTQKAIEPSRRPSGGQVVFDGVAEVQTNDESFTRPSRVNDDDALLQASIARHPEMLQAQSPEEPMGVAELLPSPLSSESATDGASHRHRPDRIQIPDSSYETGAGGARIPKLTTERTREAIERMSSMELSEEFAAARWSGPATVMQQ